MHQNHQRGFVLFPWSSPSVKHLINTTPFSLRCLCYPSSPSLPQRLSWLVICFSLLTISPHISTSFPLYCFSFLHHKPVRFFFLLLYVQISLFLCPTCLPPSPTSSVPPPISLSPSSTPHSSSPRRGLRNIALKHSPCRTSAVLAVHRKLQFFAKKNPLPSSWHRLQACVALRQGGYTCSCFQIVRLCRIIMA